MTQSSREEKKKKVIEVLNKARSVELQAIHQYMNQHYTLDDMDYGELAANVKLIAIDEMRHAEAFAERIKELGGDPTVELAGAVVTRQDPENIFSFDSEEEQTAIEAYNQFLLVCRENGDSTTVKLFETIIDDEQEHLNYFDAIDGHIKNLGSSYLARIAGTPADTGGVSKGFINKGEQG